MKRFKKISALMMASLMLALTACGNPGASSTDAEPKASTANSSGTEAAAEPDKEDMTNLVWAFKTWGTTPADMDKVEAAINEHLAETINVSVELMPIGIGDWDQKINLMLASTSEQLDLLSMSALQYGSYTSKGQLVELDELLKNQGKGIAEAVGETFLTAGKSGGVQYAVPSLRDEAAGGGFIILQDYVDKYNLDISNIKSMEDVTPILKAIRDAEPTMSPLALNRAIFPISINMEYDSLTDDFGVLIPSLDDTKVTNLFASEEYKQKVQILREWYEAGYISRDAATKDDSQPTQIQAGTAVCYFTKSKPGIEEQDEMTVGQDLAYVETRDAFATTATVQTLMWGIANNTTNPEKAMELLNLMYTDSKLINLINYGIEGEHYVVKDDGTINFPEGTTAESSKYNLSMTWQMGNQYLSHVWEGTAVDIYDQLKAFNDNARTSRALGFVFDNTSVKNQISALVSVKDQYRVALETGSVDVSVIDEFVAKLESAGINEVIAEKQKQYDAWFAEQK